MESAPEGRCSGRFSRQLQNTSCPLPPLHVFVSSPLHLLPSRSQSDLRAQRGKMRKKRGRERTRMHHHFFWIPITAQTKLARVMRKIYKTVSSFCILAFSVKKIDGFIIPLHCVHVWVCSAVCQHGTVLFGEASPAIDGALWESFSNC